MSASSSWILGSSAAIAACMAWAIGAQDVSNALGTSVGSKAITVERATVIAGVFEFLGSLMGSSVSQTISSGIIDPTAFLNPDVYMLAMLSTLFGAFVWLLLATYFSLPVSTTHSLVGSLVGVGVTAVSWSAVKTDGLLKILSSWVTSPLLGGAIAFAIFSSIHYQLMHPNAADMIFRSVPLYYGGTVGILVLFLALNGPASLQLSLKSSMVLALFTGVLTCVWYRHKLQTHGKKERDDEMTSMLEAGKPAKDTEKYSPESQFRSLMVLTACVVALAHGGNDVSNSIGPFVAILEAHRSQSLTSVATAIVPLWVLLFGGLGIVVGLGTYGYRVMATIGEKITKLTFSRGYAAQIGTALTVLMATSLGLTVSTTHCLVGAITGVALVQGKGQVNTATLKRIAFSWFVTVPVSAFFSVVIYCLLSPLVSHASSADMEVLDAM